MSKETQATGQPGQSHIKRELGWPMYAYLRHRLKDAPVLSGKQMSLSELL